MESVAGAIAKLRYKSDAVDAGPPHCSSRLDLSRPSYTNVMASDVPTTESIDKLR